MNQYDVDVLVIGGGCAGVAAGISAARRGLRTLLIENMNSLGGMMTNGYVTGPAGIIEGICKELLERLKNRAFCTTRRTRRLWIPSDANLRWNHAVAGGLPHPVRHTRR